MPEPINDFQSLLQNVAAISAELHTHKQFTSFYDACGEIINGFIGAYDVCIAMAQALTDWEKDHGGPHHAYKSLGVTWIDVIEDYVDNVITRMMETQGAPDYRDSLRALPILQAKAAT